MRVSALTKSASEYNRRLYGNQPKCGAAGPDHATCVLEPGHDGPDHEGNGYDRWGPLYRVWSTRLARD